MPYYATGNNRGIPAYSPQIARLTPQELNNQSTLDRLTDHLNSLVLIQGDGIEISRQGSMGTLISSSYEPSDGFQGPINEELCFSFDLDINPTGVSGVTGYTIEMNGGNVWSHGGLTVVPPWTSEIIDDDDLHYVWLEIFTNPCATGEEVQPAGVFVHSGVTLFEEYYGRGVSGDERYNWLIGDVTQELACQNQLGDIHIEDYCIDGLTGPTGPTGPTGTQGIQGLQGFQGAQGFQGIQGLQGFQGLQGQGLQGIQGFQGIQGITGTQGFQGFTGTQGFQGFQGITGLQGPEGLQGTYPTGLTGACSIVREGDVFKFLNDNCTNDLSQYEYYGTDEDGEPRGWKKAKTKRIVSNIQKDDCDLNVKFMDVAVFDGTEDETWTTIADLCEGNQGTQGLQGLDGAQGAQGDIGIQGFIGIQGYLGYQGLIGFQGSQGQGAQGDLGPQGYQGFDGNQGVQGIPKTASCSLIIANDDITLRNDNCSGDLSANSWYGTDEDGESAFNRTWHSAVEKRLYSSLQVDGCKLQGKHSSIYVFAGTEDETWSDIADICGAQGGQGTQGDLGPQGYQGFDGNQGIQGLAGAQGIEGTDGVQGTEGIQGTIGVQGPANACDETITVITSIQLDASNNLQIKTTEITICAKAAESGWNTISGWTVTDCN